MRASQPCDLCGCSEVYLHDGFYFCAECGTQDANFQETIIETIEVDGEILHGQKKKVHKIVEEQKQMPDAWYKWHAFNFLLKGVADELLEYGAEPSFKTKLMWVWTRYIKQFLNKTDLGLYDDPHQNYAPADEESDSDQDIAPEDMLTISDKKRDRVVRSFSFPLLVTLLYIALNLDRSKITLTHLMKLIKDGLLSVPFRIHKIVPKEMKPEKLRLKIKRGMAKFKSPIIRTIAMTLFKRLDLGNPVVPDLRLIIDNHFKELCLPTDLKPLVLSLMHYKPCSFLDVNSKDKVIWKIPAYEFHMMTYIIWALKLCLGLDCDYEVKLSSAAEAINKKEDRPKSYFIHGESAPTDRLFSYREWVTFYQFRLILLRHYCYRYANKCSWDTDDYIALEHHIDLFEGEWERDLKDEMAYDLINRIKGGEVESMVIPKSEFKPTLTPFHSYSLVLAQHLQDPEVKMKLTEDFSQYSLKYVIDDWNLVNPKSKKKKNLVRGIREGNKVITNTIHGYYEQAQAEYSKKMVYVRNCENHNWLTTKPPTMKHLVKVDKLDTSSGEQDLNMTINDVETPIEGIDSEKTKLTEKSNELNSKSNSISEVSLNSSMASRIKFVDDDDILESDKLDATEKAKLRKLNDSVASNGKFPDTISDKSYCSTLSSSIRFLDDTKVFENSKLDEVEREKLRQMHESISNPNEIKEEAEGINIFDDDFKPDIKEEVEDHCEMNVENTFDNFQDVPIGNNQTFNDNRSDISSIDSVVAFNEATFDRAGAVKELVLYTCKKHKLPVPPEYDDNKKNLRKQKGMGLFCKAIDSLAKSVTKQNKRNVTHERQRRGAWLNYVAEYNALMKNDALVQIAQKVNMAIQNANHQAETTLSNDNAAADMDIDNLNDDTMNNDVNNDNSKCEILNETNVNDTINDDHDSDVQSKHDSDEEKLFSDESDGETHAKELLPEKNPDFDEEVYDATQLYVKAAKPTGEGEMELDPTLSGIIDKKMTKDNINPSLLTWTQEKPKPERCDSEDEMPLSVLQELNVLREKLSKQEEEGLDPFLEEEVDGFLYWYKFYKFQGPEPAVRRIFEKELNDFPSSFSFLLRQCALILGVSEAELYRNLQKFETTAAEKLKLKLPKHKIKKYNEAQY